MRHLTEAAFPGPGPAPLHGGSLLRTADPRLRAQSPRALASPEEPRTLLVCTSFLTCQSLQIFNPKANRKSQYRKQTSLHQAREAVSFLWEKYSLIHFPISILLTSNLPAPVRSSEN